MKSILEMSLGGAGLCFLSLGAVQVDQVNVV
jgi:hypothetical protein